MDTASSSHGIALKTMGDIGSIKGPTGRRKFETCPDRGANLNGCPSSLARLFWLDASQGLVGCQLEFFDLTLNEIPDLGLQRRLGDSPHLEGERD